MPHRTYRRLGHRALGLLPFGRDERGALVVVFVGVAAVQGLAVALGLTVVCAIGILAHRQSHRGRLNHLRAALRRRAPVRYARRVADPLRTRGHR